MPRRTKRQMKASLKGAELNMAMHQRMFSFVTPKARVIDQNDPVGKTLAVDYSFTTDDLDTHSNIQRFMVRLSLTCSTAAVQIGNLNQYFEQVQFYAGKDPQNAFKTYRGDELWVLDGIGHSLADDPRAREDTNYWGVRGQWGETLQVGVTRDFYISFPGMPLESLGVEQTGEFRIKFNLRKDCVISGTAANVAISSFEILLFENDLSTHEGPNAEHERALYHKHAGQGVEHHYLDMQQEQYSSEIFTAATEKKLDFTADGHCVGQVVLIRPSGYETTGGSALTNLSYLGKDATISISRKGHGNKNLLTDDGGTVTIRELQGMHRIRFAEESGALFIPYSPNMLGDMLNGTHTGGMNFGGEEYTIRITPAAAVTDAVFSFDCTNAANDGGSYRLGWQGEWTAPLAFNATVGAMKTAFEALKVCQEYDLTATFSATAVTDFTLTISNATFDVARRFGLPAIDALTLNDGTVVEICTVTNSTQYQDGSDVAGGTFDVDILSWSWHRLGAKGGYMHHEQVQPSESIKKN